MKIDFKNYDLTEFLVREGTICGLDGILVQPPHIGIKFNQQNKIFRSSIWDRDGNLLSAGFKKFVNWGENPEQFPDPASLKNCNVLTKIDGSTLIVDYLNDQLNMRTRGTFNYTALDNPEDFEYVLNRYDGILNLAKMSPDQSILFEIVTPNMKIVLDYGDEPDCYLIGIVNKKDYTMVTQRTLDEIAKTFHLKRPSRYNFDSIPNMQETIKTIQGVEGVCVYFNNDQDIKKLKSDTYLTLHAFKSNLTYENMVELFVEWGQPDMLGFLARIEAEFDFECRTASLPLASQVCDAKRKVDAFIKGAEAFCSKLEGLSRKEQANKIFESYGKDSNRSGYIFRILDKKPLDTQAKKKLLWQMRG